MEIRQKSGQERRDFSITSSGLLYGVKSDTAEDQTFIPFELLSRKKVFYRERYVPFQTAFLLCGVSGGAGALFTLISGTPGLAFSSFLVFLSGVFLLLYKLFKRDYHKLLLRSDNYVYILKDKPDRKAYDEFLQNLYSERDNYLKHRYFWIDEEEEPETLVHRYKWLKDEGVIDGREYLDICEQLEIDAEEFSDYSPEDDIF